MKKIDNYLDSVHKNLCNASKGDSFEIIGIKRAELPKYKDWNDFFGKTHIKYKDLIDEKPKMLHPVLDDPEEYLFFEANGTVTYDKKPKENHERSEYFLETCKISDFTKRPILVEDRKFIVEEIRKSIESYENISNDNELKEVLYALLLGIIDKIDDKTTPFSAVYRSCFNNFDVFFISKLSQLYQNRLRIIYKSIISG